MAEKSADFIIWNTAIPSTFNPRRASTDFELLGVRWVLEMQTFYALPFRRLHFKVSLRRIGSEHPGTYFSAKTFILNTNYIYSGHFQSQDYHQTVIDEVTTLVTYDMETTTRPNIDNFQMNTNVMVVCVLSSVMPTTECGIPNETVEVMTPTDFEHALSVKSIPNLNRSSDGCEQGSSSLSPNLESLSRDLSKLLEDKIVPDVHLRCGDRTIGAHKAILAARSQVFSTIFQSRMLESETGVVDIADIDVHVLEMLLKYIYSGQLSDVPDELLSSLYAAADKYAVSSLKTACSERMTSNLTRENCLNTLLLANAHSDLDFKNVIFNFLLNHTEILKSQEWTRFCMEFPILSIEVFQTVVQQNYL